MAEPQTVEALLSYAGKRFYQAGVPFRGGRMSRLIRSIGNTTQARAIVDAYLAQEIDGRTWRGFELYAVGGYKDPTGATAARNVDTERGRN